MAKERIVRTIKPVNEMAGDMMKERESIAQNPNNRSMYKPKDPERDIRLSMAIKTRADSIRNDNVVKVDFNDIEDVRQRTVDYLDACAIASVYPTMLGLAVHGFGVSRQAIYQRMNHHPDSESSQFLRQVSDMFADILVNDSLRRHCDCVSAIFVLKNLYGFRDNVEQPISDAVVDNDSHDVNFYKSKYGKLITQE